MSAIQIAPAWLLGGWGGSKTCGSPVIEVHTMYSLTLSCSYGEKANQNVFFFFLPDLFAKTLFKIALILAKSH